MTHLPAFTAFQDQDRRRATDAIRSHGCSITYVSDDAGCACCRAIGTPSAPKRHRPRPSFAYTTGLHGIGHPELLVHALDQHETARLLNELTHHVMSGQDLTPGELLKAGGVQLVVERVPNPGKVFLSANDYYQRPPEASVAGLQLTWADEKGRLPWHPACGNPARRQPRPGQFRA